MENILHALFQKEAPFQVLVTTFKIKGTDQRKNEALYPRWLCGKEFAYQCRRCRHVGSIPGLGISTGEGNGNLLQYPCLENCIDRGAWWATVYGVMLLLMLTSFALNINSFCFQVRWQDW